MNSQLTPLSNYLPSPEVIHLPSPLLAISERKKSGLILCKQYNAEFAGPGAAINVSAESTYRAVIAIGSPDLVALRIPEERKSAYGRRIQWNRWLQRIIEHPEPMVRVEKLLSGFEEFFGRAIVMGLPIEVLALLAGVFPATVERVRSQHGSTLNSPTLAYLPNSEQLKVTTLRFDQSHSGTTDVPLLTTATLHEIERTYAVLQAI